MTYRSGTVAGLVLFGLSAFVFGPGIALLSKYLTLNSVGPVALSMAMAGISGMLYLVVGEVGVLFNGRTRRVYSAFVRDPTFYWLTALKAVSFYTYFRALAYIPATVVVVTMVLLPGFVYLLRHVYRPKAIQSNVIALTGVGLVSLYLAQFGLDRPSVEASNILYGALFAVATLLLVTLYTIEKEAAVNKTETWFESLRFGALHRIGIALLFVPFVRFDTVPGLSDPLTGASAGLLLLGAAASAGWFTHLHVTRLLGAYYSAYGQLIKAGVVAAGEVVLFGIVLSPSQYIGVTGLLGVFVLLVRDVHGGAGEDGGDTENRG